MKVPRSGKVAPPTAGMPSRHSGQISKSRIFELADVSGRSERPSSEPVVLPLSLRHRMPVDLVGSGPESLPVLNTFRLRRRARWFHSIPAHVPHSFDDFVELICFELLTLAPCWKNLLS